MPTLIATYNVRFFWKVPDDVVLVSIGETDYDTAKEGYWYIRHATLHYYWKGEWNEIEGIEDGFTTGVPKDAEFQDD